MALHTLGNNTSIDEDSDGNYRVQTSDGTFVVDGSATISELQNSIDSFDGSLEGKADAQGGSIGDQTPLESLHTEKGHIKHNVSGATHNIVDYGADPTGSEPIDDVLDEVVAAASPQETILFPEGTYYIANNHTYEKPLHLKGVNATIEHDNTETYAAAIQFGSENQAVTGTNSGLSSPPSRGDYIVSVADASLFEPEDRVFIQEQSDSTGGVYKFEFNIVKEVDEANNELELGRNLTFNYVDQTGPDGGGRVDKVNLLKRPIIEGFEAQDSTDSGVDFFQMQWCENPIYRDLTVSDYFYFAFRFRNSWKPVFDNVEARNAHNRIGSGGRGEPLRLHRCNDFHIDTVRAYHCRRGVDLANGSHTGAIINPIIRNACIAGISHHDALGHDTVIIGGSVVSDNIDEYSMTGIGMNTGNVSVFGTTVVTNGSGIKMLDRNPDVKSSITAEGVHIESAHTKEFTGNAVYSECEHTDISATVDDTANQFGGDDDPNGKVAVVGNTKPIKSVNLDIEIEGGRPGYQGIGPLSINGDTAPVNNVDITLTAESNGTARELGQFYGEINGMRLTVDAREWDWHGLRFNAGTFTDVHISDSNIICSDVAAIRPLLFASDSTFENVWITNSHLAGQTSSDVRFSGTGTNLVMTGNLLTSTDGVDTVSGGTNTDGNI